MDDRFRIHGLPDWEAGLPSLDQLASLSLSLIPPDLASAFRILPEPLRTSGEVNRASHSTLASLRDGKPVADCEGYQKEGSDPKKSRLMDPIDGVTGGGCLDDLSMDVSEAAVKKSRLVWTPQLHKRFVEVVAHLGLKNAMPKTIMKLMNVEGLTRENVASHLQKYRLYNKRMQGWSDEGPSPSDHLFASNEATSNGGTCTGNGSENRLPNNGTIPIQMPYPLPPHFTAVPAENVNSGYHGIQQQHNAMMMMQQQHNNMMMMMQQQQQQQQRDWPGNVYYHAMNQNQK